MVGLVAGHHLVAADTVGDGVHDGPLGRGRVPAALGFLGGQFDDAGAAEVHAELAVVDEDAGPDDLARFADALERAAAEAEVHGGLALAAGAGPPVDEMGGWGAAG